MVIQLKVTLKDVRPQIWRRLRVPGEYTLAELHHVLQVAMGWENAHLHEFKVDRRTYSEPGAEDGEDLKDERELRLADFAKKGKLFTYTYDFGDDWIHELAIEGVDVEATDGSATCTGGKRACPLEDSHGPLGHMNLCRALSNPRRRDHEEMRDWAGDFDPEAFDLPEINRRLLDLFVPRRARRTRSQQSG